MFSMLKGVVRTMRKLPFPGGSLRLNGGGIFCARQAVLHACHLAAGSFDDGGDELDIATHIGKSCIHLVACQRFLHWSSSAAP